ncbi:MAG TPA: hypothetical protein V6D25_29460 [Leptolyngbyaceae cyanobacterium]
MSEQQDVLAEILKKIREKEADELEDEEIENREYGDDYVNQLKYACENLLKKENFAVGQIVKWKKHLKNRKLPYRNQPAIVVSLLDKPVISTTDESGSPYFLETLDIILGIIVDDGTFLTFYYDSRRFQSY